MTEVPFPRQINFGSSPLESGITGPATGPPLSVGMVRWLDRPVESEDVAQRTLRLAVEYPALAQAFTLLRAGHDTESIAQTCSVSVRTAQRRVRGAIDFVTKSFQWEIEPPEKRLEMLAVIHPRAHDAYLMRAHHWAPAQVAALLGVSERVVRRDVAFVDTLVGEVPVSVIRRRRGVRLMIAA